MYSVDGQFVLRRFGQDKQIEAFADPHRAATVTLLGTDHLPLDGVTSDHELMRSDADVQWSVIPRVQCRTGLQMNLAATGNRTIVREHYFWPHDHHFARPLLTARRDFE